MADMNGWGRGDQKRNAVAMTEQDLRIAVDMMAEVIRNRTNEDSWNQYKRLIQLEADLARAVEEISRRDATIAGLNDQVTNLKSILLAMGAQAPATAPAPVWQPYSPTPPVTFQSPYPGSSVTAPVPPPYNTTITVPADRPGMLYRYDNNGIPSEPIYPYPNNNGTLTEFPKQSSGE